MKKILVIEDNPNIRANILELLEAEEYDVCGAENGLIGALWAQEHIPDLILCDVMMPEVNGHEVLSALQASPETASIPFIFLTALADKTDIRTGIELGADDYLTKPYTREELLGAITCRFAKQDLLKQQYNVGKIDAVVMEQKMEELQKHVETKESILQDCQKQLQKAVPKLTVAMHLLESLKPGSQRDRCLEILKEACTEEINLLKQMPNVEELLPVGNDELFAEVN